MTSLSAEDSIIGFADNAYKIVREIAEFNNAKAH